MSLKREKWYRKKKREEEKEGGGEGERKEKAGKRRTQKAVGVSVCVYTCSLRHRSIKGELGSGRKILPCREKGLESSGPQRARGTAISESRKA